MKIKFILLFLSLIVAKIFAAPMVIQLIERTEVFPGAFEYSTVYQYVDVQPYTSGGLTFIYPAGIFASTPMVTVSLEDFSMTLTSTNITAPWITVNSATQTTIYAVRDDGNGGYQEVPTNGANVHIKAVGRP